jgi:hypothetical protein
MRALLLFFIPFIFTACNKDNDVSGSPEMLIIDSVITTTVDDHGFVFFDAPVSGGSNWKSPYDFYNGNFEYRFEVRSYPSQKTFLINVCIWADIVGDWQQWKETCTDQLAVNGNGVYSARSSPSAWWIMNDPVDFSRVGDFDHMGIVLWCSDYKNLSDYSSSSQSCWDQRNSFLPLTLRLTIVAVASGYTFSGWEEFID